MVRVRAEQALGEKDRRAGSAARPPVGRDARSIALAQLRQIADVPGDVIEPLVLNRSVLQECPGADAEVVRAFAEQILQQRRRREAQEKVFFRREDIDTLSRLLQCSADGVNPLLDRLGVLA
jgi:predicted ATPase